MTKGERQGLEALWRKRVSDLRSSGVTQAAWAEANHVSLYQVHYWNRKFRQAGEDPAPSRPRFIALTVAGSSDEPPPSAPPPSHGIPSSVCVTARSTSALVSPFPTGITVGSVARCPTYPSTGPFPRYVPGGP